MSMCVPSHKRAKSESRLQVTSECLPNGLRDGHLTAEGGVFLAFSRFPKISVFSVFSVFSVSALGGGQVAFFFGKT